MHPSELRPLAPAWRAAEVGALEAKPGVAVALKDGELRTVLAQQRTHLAFVRTALAVVAAFGGSAAGLVLGLLVLVVGTWQYAWMAPLYLANTRIDGQVDARTLFNRARFDAVLIGVLMFGIGVAAAIYRWDSQTVSSVTEAATAAMLPAVL